MGHDIFFCINTNYNDSNDVLNNVVAGEKDSGDDLTAKAATATAATAANKTKTKKTYSWEIDESRSPR